MEDTWGGGSHLPAVSHFHPISWEIKASRSCGDLTMTALAPAKLGLPHPGELRGSGCEVSPGEAQCSEKSLGAPRENGTVLALWELKLSTYGCFQSRKANTTGRQ